MKQLSTKCVPPHTTHSQQVHEVRVSTLALNADDSADAARLEALERAPAWLAHGLYLAIS